MSTTDIASQEPANPFSTAMALEWTDEELLPLLPASVQGREKDVLAFYRELPRLIADGEDGRTAVVHGGQVISIWDTLGDATQAAYQQFGIDGVFLTATVRKRDLDRLPLLLAQHRKNPCPK